MICYQNWHKEEDRSNYNALIMLPKAAISERGSFRETCDTGNSNLSTLSLRENWKLQSSNLSALKIISGQQASTYSSAQQKSSDPVGFRVLWFRIASQLCFKIFVKLDDYRIISENTQKNSIGLVLRCYLESPTHRIIHENLKIVPCSPEILC